MFPLGRSPRLFEAKPSIMTPFSACVNDQVEIFSMPYKKAGMPPA
jgi:hypothetical protein